MGNLILQVKNSRIALDKTMANRILVLVFLAGGNRMKRRLFALALALLLAVSLPDSALAETWYLEDGNITVSATENGQYVSQGGNNVRDDDPTITQKDSSKETGSTIKIETTGDATADVTIEKVNIKSSGAAIDVGSSSANITLKGGNKIFSESGSALHVSSGDVTIDGEPYTGPVKVVAGTKITVAATAKPGYSFAADPSGEYTITGDRTINAKATANGRTITVIGEANIGGEKTITKPINEEVEVVLTANKCSAPT